MAQLTTTLMDILDTEELLHVVKTASDKVLPSLQKIVEQKYLLMLAYPYYGNQLLSLSRDGLYDHLKQHQKEEAAQLYQVQKKIVAMGGKSSVPVIDSGTKWADIDDTKAVLQHLLQLEKQSVSLWEQLYKVTRDMIPLNSLAQNYAQECEGHADDMARYLRSFG